MSDLGYVLCAAALVAEGWLLLIKRTLETRSRSAQATAGDFYTHLRGHGPGQFGLAFNCGHVALDLSNIEHRALPVTLWGKLCGFKAT